MLEILNICKKKLSKGNVLQMISNDGNSTADAIYWFKYSFQNYP